MALLRGDEKMLVLRFFVWLVSLLSFGFVSLGTVTYSLVDEGESFDQTITFEEFLIENDNGYFINDVYLENMIENGDFSVDSNSDGLADNWIGSGSGSRVYTLENGIQKGTQSTTGSVVVYQNINFVENCMYYLKYNAEEFFSSAGFYIMLTPSNSILSMQDLDGRYIFESNFTDSKIYFGTISAALSNEYFTIDNVILINLTKTFGTGNEPSLSDFELFYIDDVDYFDEMTVNGYYVDVDDLDFQALYEEFFQEDFVDFELSDLDVERNVEYTFTSEEITINDVVLMIAFGLFWVLIIRMIGGIIYVRFNS